MDAIFANLFCMIGASVWHLESCSAAQQVRVNIALAGSSVDYQIARMRLAGGGATHRDKQGGRIEFPEAGLVGSVSVSIEGRRHWTYRSLPVAYGQNCSQQ
jgi:hypothetical protein